MITPRLTKCPTCEGDVSTLAAACPKCGHAFPRAGGGIDEGDPVHAIGIILAFLILIGGVVFGIYSCQESLSVQPPTQQPPPVQTG